MKFFLSEAQRDKRVVTSFTLNILIWNCVCFRNGMWTMFNCSEKWFVNSTCKLNYALNKIKINFFECFVDFYENVRMYLCDLIESLFELCQLIIIIIFIFIFDHIYAEKMPNIRDWVEENSSTRHYVCWHIEERTGKTRSK